ncbi:disulfide bond formation protein B [Methylovirgula sp. 4M-Z18]|uniref:disulfide bond formation protein B n=1 Tax=Methylovirgula sp. 4M-Z18 TaxID=2293567 RepID=UPI000E2E48A8|nr:disulfide bond formation protein B [Methylovirgula sp. 4M-Z18]RFB75542.1 disulfide bond formation protein B [Methylovirgula sp. 4M-Z18]
MHGVVQNKAVRGLSALQIACLISGIAFLTIAGAWIFQAFGYAPCELCLKQRPAYYGGVPLALLTVFLLRDPKRKSMAVGCFAGLAIIFAANCAFGIYHAGVEWQFWPGPTDCTGSYTPPANPDDFLSQLQSAPIVRCDQVAIRILGLSLAGWNAVISACITILSLLGLRKA